MKTRHLVVGTAVAGLATFAATGVDAHQPGLELTCSHVRAEMFLYPAGSTYTLTVDGAAHSLNAAGYYDAALTPTVNHTATFHITSSDGQGNFNQTLTRDNCVPTTTTTVAPTTTTGATTSLPPTSSTTTPTSTVAPSTSTTAATTAPTVSTSSPAPSGPLPSTPSVPPSTPSSEQPGEMCQTSSTSSDGETSSDCATPSTPSSTNTAPGTAPTSSTSATSSGLPKTGADDSGTLAGAGLAALIGGTALVFVARRRRT